MGHRTRSWINLPSLVCATFVLCGCSQFDRQWQDAGKQAVNGIDGRWEGKWVSQQDGHTGPLSCVIHQTGSDSYAASFNATYGSIFHFSYDAKLAGQQIGDLVYLSGETDLGWPVGVYHYEGSASPSQFYCAYRSKGDHGYFALARSGDQPPTQLPQPQEMRR